MNKGGAFVRWVVRVRQHLVRRKKDGGTGGEGGQKRYEKGAAHRSQEHHGRLSVSPELEMISAIGRKTFLRLCLMDEGGLAI